MMTSYPEVTADRLDPGTGDLPEPACCANHPDRETRVSCSDCGKPICPDCMVFSAVGIKCADCARLPKSALVRLKPERMVAAVGAALGVGTAVGFLYYLLLATVGYFFFAFFVAAGIGWVVGEAVFRASGSYRGRESAIIAVLGTAWAFLFPPLVSALTSWGFRWQSVVFALSARGLITWLMLGIASYVAWQRNR